VIVLDTNIVSVLMAVDSHRDSQIVEEWLDQCGDERICATAVTQAEVAAGIAILPEGRRKQTLKLAAGEFFESMAEHMLPFNSTAAQAYGEIIGERKRQGRPVAVLDAQIGAIARSSRAKLATRNHKDFTGLGLRVVNPYEPQTWR
jgi:predicted nucleic acid-binding protein